MSAIEWLLTFLGRFLETLNFELNSYFLSNLMQLQSTCYKRFWRGMNLKILLSVPSAQNFIIWMNVLKESIDLFAQKSALTFCFLLEKAEHCGNKLVNKVILKNGATKFYSLKVYCWKSIRSQIENILQKMTELCEHWRTRQVGESVLSDVYDGEVWKNLSG